VLLSSKRTFLCASKSPCESSSFAGFAHIDKFGSLHCQLLANFGRRRFVTYSDCEQLHITCLKPPWRSELGGDPLICGHGLRCFLIHLSDHNHHARWARFPGVSLSDRYDSAHHCSFLFSHLFLTVLSAQISQNLGFCRGFLT
jgi:hypothetical protein